MEWLDNLKEEIAYPFVMARQWYEASEDNRTAFWLTTIATCVVTCIFYTAAGLGLRAVVRAVSDNTEIVVVSGNPCINPKGLVKSYAPAACYEDKNPHPVINPRTVEPSATTATPQLKRQANGGFYDPPCGPKSDAHACTDQIYSKRLVEGEIYTATFNGDEKRVDDDHLQPDYTEVQFLSLIDDQEAPPNEKFCGNVLDKFTPGKKFKMVINESKQSDYNGCYVIEVVEFTFGGSPLYAKHK